MASNCPSYVQRPPESKVFIGNAHGVFAAVPVISLQRTPDRFLAFQERIAAVNWPFAKPELFSAVDGMATRIPKGYSQGGPAHGCLQSHLNIARMALEREWNRPVLVLEDDCEFTPDAGNKLTELLPQVPADADMFYVGCQLHRPITKMVDGIVLAKSGAGRTHAYVMYPKFFQPILDLLSDCKVHIDWELERLAKAGKIIAYAASPVLAIQAAGFSTIRFQHDGPRSWDSSVRNGHSFDEKPQVR